MSKQSKKDNHRENSAFRIPTSEFDNPVLFVGAGPGDPELITVKGQKALRAADLVIYAGSLVPQALLQWTREGTSTISSASMHLEEIVTEIQRAHSEGRRVVRLHTGDPSLYGAIYEQMSELSKRGIPYKIIPGVTAAFAAAAALGIEYTLPEVSQTLILTRMTGRTPVPEKENLASLARHQASMAIYLSMSVIDEVSKILCDAYGENSPCAVVYRASQPEEQIILTPLKELSARVAAEKITKHALIVAGRVLAINPDELIHKSKLYDMKFKHEYRS
ncbi:MAG: precorrin-4 C(11)-methyltransferase [Deltaproteobacteria bacterium]|jgi:precorrin-4/cobalt-precorrin-4 C11-methyltransferase|nr:precorrin-4 C(11)-methyltransferase [Deltaproteobacteria bacterium]